jgi:hypothetical protein
VVDRLLVVATNNGDDRVRQIVAATDTPILVVDTNLERGPRPDDILDKPHVVGWLQTPYGGYDTGAYLWAYFNVEAAEYMFMQDSCLPRSRDFVDTFHDYMPGPMGVVAWNLFSLTIWDSPEQRTAVDFTMGQGAPWPDKGIFGPIFYTSRLALDRLARKRLLPPYALHKQGAQGMERAWAIGFHRVGIPVRGLTDTHEPDRAAMAAGRLPLLTKSFGGRA